MIKFHCVAEDKYAKLLQNASSSSSSVTPATIPDSEESHAAQPQTASAVSSGEELRHEDSAPKEMVGSSKPKPVGKKETTSTGHESSSQAPTLGAEKETASSAADPEPEAASSPQKIEAIPEHIHEDSPPASPLSNTSSNEEEQKLNTIVDRWIFFEE